MRTGVLLSQMVIRWRVWSITRWIV